MHMKSLALVAVLAVSACADQTNPVAPARVTPPAATAAAQSMPQPVDNAFTTMICGFPLRVELDGKFKEIVLPGDRVIAIVPGSTATITNPANGRRERSRMLYISRQLPAYGNVELVLVGRNISRTRNSV